MAWESRISTSGDIFSFWILVLEMFPRRKPTDDIFKEELTLHNFVKKGLFEQAMTKIIDCKIFELQMESSQYHNLKNMRNNNKLIECMILIFEIDELFC